jgi:hypothetical protein
MDRNDVSVRGHQDSRGGIRGAKLQQAAVRLVHFRAKNSVDSRQRSAMDTNDVLVLGHQDSRGGIIGAKLQQVIRGAFSRQKFC